MSTTEASIDLSLFLPENFPSEQEIETLIASAYNRVPARTGLERTARALLHLTMGNGMDKWYDHQHRSLESAIGDGKFDCLTSTAFVCLVGKILPDVACVPTLRHTRLSRDCEANDYDLHAFTTFRSNNGELVQCGTTELTRIQADQDPQSYKPHEQYILSNLEMFNQSDVIQLREGFDGSKSVLRSWATKDAYDPWETREVHTYFCGDEGMRSFLSTIELISAKTCGREPDIRPGQLIPRI